MARCTKPLHRKKESNARCLEQNSRLLAVFHPASCKLRFEELNYRYSLHQIYMSTKMFEFINATVTYWWEIFLKDTLYYITSNRYTGINFLCFITPMLILPRRWSQLRLTQIKWTCSLYKIKWQLSKYWAQKTEVIPNWKQVPRSNTS